MVILSDESRFSAVIVLPISWENGGVVLAHSRSELTPYYWEFPGRRSRLGESPEKAAVRALEEKTGLSVEEGDLFLLTKQPRGENSLHFFRVFVEGQLPFLKEKGDKEEEIRFFPNSEFDALGDGLFPHHRALLNLSEVQKNLGAL